METMTNVQQVSLQDLRIMLSGIKGAKPATITAVTEVKMNKGRGENKNPYHGRVTKRQVSNVFINFSYKNAVNKRLTKEGKEADFVPQERAWGVKVTDTPLVLHKEQYYLEAGFITKNTPNVEYLLDNEPTDKAVFENFMQAKSSSSRQGLSEDNEVVLRTFKLDTIESIKVNGVTYIVTK
jgi:hypothetical protein